MVEVKRPSVRAYIGTTGSGKGWSIRQHLKDTKPDRLVIFDPLREYGDIARPVSLADCLRGMQGQRFRLAWQPEDETDFEGKAFKAAFALWCRACFAAAPLVMLVEELELVTRPSWAPPAWRMCTKRGRHVGLQVIAATQRPADCDKAFLSCCTYVRAFALREADDRARVAKALDVEQARIDALQTVAMGTRTRITYFERDYLTGEQGESTVTLGR